MKNSRYMLIARKMDSASKLMAIAVIGLASANKGNPFISKGDAMARISSVRKYQKQLSMAWVLELNVLRG